MGSVLYVAAHPDDENTRMISYFANHKHYHTTYLSLTRGDGGQNLVGPEIGDLLGLIRTQELLMARQVDGGNQMFSRARDFGYSKHSDETLSFWHKDEVLSDVVWTIRKTRPDIIINRFDHRTPGSTHGHHTASAILAEEALQLSGDRNAFTNQLSIVKPWTPSRLFFNTSWWFYGSQENFEKADKSNLLAIDVGTYYPLLGKSNNEIAAQSRSMHKSQGFGATGSRGTEVEYIELVHGTLPETDPLEGINTTWSRLSGGKAIAEALAQIELSYDLNNPANSLDKLLEVYKMIESIPDDGFWIPRKLQELQDLISHCSGIFVEAVAADYSVAPGNSLQITVEAINRSSQEIFLEKVAIAGSSFDTTLHANLENNIRSLWKSAVILDPNLPYSGPYWLKDEGTAGMFDVPDQALRGVPESPAALHLDYTLTILGRQLKCTTPLVYKENDPVNGETYRPLEVSPPVFLNFTEDLYVFGSQTPRSVQVLVKSNAEDLSGAIVVDIPDGWQVEPSEQMIDLKQKGEEALLQFTIMPPSDASEENISLKFRNSADNSVHVYSATFIEYDHIPVQTILKPATTKVVKLDLQITGRKVGYVMGAGDNIPDYLEQIGY
ncbi:MAG: PIG-L family deacetylase, partial [Saprospiraceae bacterium]|nr:PIG-L family deacetylase [Saprospiraceae bacterium]